MGGGKPPDPQSSARNAGGGCKVYVCERSNDVTASLLMYIIQICALHNITTKSAIYLLNVLLRILLLF